MNILNGASLLIMGGIFDPLSVNRIQAKSGPLKIGSTTSGCAFAGTNDLFVVGRLEVDSLVYLDDALTGPSHSML